MHLPTLVIMTLATNVLIGFYLSVLYRRKPKDKCFKLWALSCGSFVIGAALASSRSYNIPEFFTFFVADFLLVLTPTFILLGLIQFSRFRYTKRKRKQYFAAFGTVVGDLSALSVSKLHCGAGNRFVVWPMCLFIA